MNNLKSLNLYSTIEGQDALKCSAHKLRRMYKYMQPIDELQLVETWLEHSVLQGLYNFYMTGVDDVDHKTSVHDPHTKTREVKIWRCWYKRTLALTNVAAYTMHEYVTNEHIADHKLANTDVSAGGPVTYQGGNSKYVPPVSVMTSEMFTIGIIEGLILEAYQHDYQSKHGGAAPGLSNAETAVAIMAKHKLSAAGDASQKTHADRVGNATTERQKQCTHGDKLFKWPSKWDAKLTTQQNLNRLPDARKLNPADHYSGRIGKKGGGNKVGGHHCQLPCCPNAAAKKTGGVALKKGISCDYYCNTCKVVLCPYPCMALYHGAEKYVAGRTHSLLL